MFTYYAHKFFLTLIFCICIHIFVSAQTGLPFIIRTKFPDTLKIRMLVWPTSTSIRTLEVKYGYHVSNADGNCYYDDKWKIIVSEIFYKEQFTWQGKGQ